MPGYVNGEISVDGHTIIAHFSEDEGGLTAKVECPAELEIDDVITVGGKPWQVADVRVLQTIDGAYSFADLKPPSAA